MTTLADLKPDSRNARRHNARNVGMIESSLQRDGFGRSILLANDGTIIAGNATIDAAASAGIEDVLVVESDGTRVIAVKRTDVASGSDAALNLALSDNRAAELAEWDSDVLAGLRDERGLDDFWREGELAHLLGDELPDLDPSAAWQGMPEYKALEGKPVVKRVAMLFACAEDVQAFAELIGQVISMDSALSSLWYPAKPIQRASAEFRDVDES